MHSNALVLAMGGRGRAHLVLPLIQRCHAIASINQGVEE